MTRITGVIVGLVAAGLLGPGAGRLGAQAPHPCDGAWPTVYRQPAGALPRLRVGFCFPLVDTTGLALTAPVGFALIVNGGPAIDLGRLVPVVGANAAGLRYYEFSHPALAAGTITITAYLAQVGMSAPSAPITLTLLGVPTAPQQVTLTR